MLIGKLRKCDENPLAQLARLRHPLWIERQLLRRQHIGGTANPAMGQALVELDLAATANPALSVDAQIDGNSIKARCKSSPCPETNPGGDALSKTSCEMSRASSGSFSSPNASENTRR